jgi:hypothetical protein
MNTPRLIGIGASLLLLCGCATTHQRYDWGNYESSLYVYYKNPASAPRFVQSLQDLIATANKTGRPVAPGIYAEYGYLLMQEGKSQDAIAAFRQEEDHWPESKAFMDQMMKAAASAGPTTKGS